MKDIKTTKTAYIANSGGILVSRDFKGMQIRLTDTACRVNCIIYFEIFYQEIDDMSFFVDNRFMENEYGNLLK